MAAFTRAFSIEVEPSEIEGWYDIVKVPGGFVASGENREMIDLLCKGANLLLALNERNPLGCYDSMMAMLKRLGIAR